MKSSVLREIPDNELNDLLIESREKLAKLKMSHAVSPLENPHVIRFTRKDIAKVLTEKKRREIATKQNKN